MKGQIKRMQKGFTLIELLIVVAIIGVLSAMAIPAYKNQIVKSDIASGVSTTRALLTNTDLHLQEKSTFPPNSADGFTAIGAATDMSSLGTLSIESVSGANGTIKFLFNAKSAVAGSDVKFARTASGWKCTFTKEASLTIASDALPKGCS